MSQPSKIPSVGAANDGPIALQVMLETWRIQYHTTQGMNTRIAALLAFSGILLGLLLNGGTLSERDPLGVAGIALLLLAICCLLAASLTRWGDQPTVAQLEPLDALGAAHRLDKLVAENKTLLRRKSHWMEAAIALILAALLALTAAAWSESETSDRDSSLAPRLQLNGVGRGEEPRGDREGDRPAQPQLPVSGG